MCIAIVVLVSSCARRKADALQIRFALDVGAAGDVTIQDLRFYVHDIELIEESGRAYPFTLAAAPPWQSERVALIDLAGSSAAERNSAVRGTIAGDARSFSAVRFTVGVPFDLNHADPLQAAAPLNRPELFWTWQSGYKFLRVDLGDSHGQWSFHLGSTGCSSAAAVRPPAAPCAQPNLVRIEITGLDVVHGAVELQLNELAASMRAAGYAICTGGYAHNPACAEVFAKTGLELETGQCPSGVCRGQKVFK